MLIKFRNASFALFCGLCGLKADRVGKNLLDFARTLAYRCFAKVAVKPRLTQLCFKVSTGGLLAKSALTGLVGMV